MAGKAGRRAKAIGGVIGHIPRQEQPQRVDKKDEPAPRCRQRGADPWVMPEMRRLFAENAQLRADNSMLRGEIARLRLIVGEDEC